MDHKSSDELASSSEDTLARMNSLEAADNSSLFALHRPIALNRTIASNCFLSIM